MTHGYFGTYEQPCGSLYNYNVKSPVPTYVSEPNRYRIKSELDTVPELDIMFIYSRARGNFVFRDIWCARCIFKICFINPSPELTIFPYGFQLLDLQRQFGHHLALSYRAQICVGMFQSKPIIKMNLISQNFRRIPSSHIIHWFIHPTHGILEINLLRLENTL